MVTSRAVGLSADDRAAGRGVLDHDHGREHSVANDLVGLLIGTIYPALKSAAAAIGMPWWLSGLLIDGVYLATAWVISVMLPPMAIFFPLFTLLEDFGYLPRVAFNLDNLFKKAGAHGKQALSMTMGFGCNAAGVVATRIIDSPRERLIAIITNNFALCNGRWPTQILIATIFIGALVTPALGGLVSALAVVSVAVLGVVLTFVVSRVLSRTVLKGEVSTFSLELPPYRPPRIWQTIYTSIIDRTLVVLWRAIKYAAPAGAVIWLSANITIGGISIAEHLVNLLNPIGVLIGLNGVILVAYIVAIPANEIVIPTILMLTVMITRQSGVGAGAGVMFEMDDNEHTGAAAGGRLDAADGGQPDAVQPDPQSVQHHAVYHLQRNGQPQMDDRGGAAAAGTGLCGDVFRRTNLALISRRIKDQTMKFVIRSSLLIVVLMALAACGRPIASTQPDDLAQRPINAVTTIGMIGDIVKNVGGERVKVTGLMGPGVDPHLYKASEGDVIRLGEADVVFYNGLHLEAAMSRVFERMGDRIKTVAVTDDIDRDWLAHARRI